MISLNAIQFASKRVIRAINAHGFVWNDVFSYWEAHAGTETKSSCDGAANDAVPTHDFGRHVTQRSCHFFVGF